MARYVRVENGISVEVIDTGDFEISQLYAPSFVETMVRVGEGIEVEIGTPLDEAPAQINPPQPELKTDAVQVPGETEQAPVNVDRTWRQASFLATEWLVIRHRDEQELGRGTTLMPQQYLELLEYRQALRDWPDSSHFPSAASRPSVPAWLAAPVG